MTFGLVDVGPGDLLSHFPDLAEAAKRCGAGCKHDAEKDCALLPLPRYDSYRRILSSLNSLPPAPAEREPENGGLPSRRKEL
jgi:putative ribosome biogenesis GTPase RsgA